MIQDQEETLGTIAVNIASVANNVEETEAQIVELEQTKAREARSRCYRLACMFLFAVISVSACYLTIHLSS
jgi:hypothetical protein